MKVLNHFNQDYCNIIFNFAEEILFHKEIRIMRTLKLILLSFTLLLSTTIAVSQDLPYKKETKEGKEYYIYQVASGEGLYSICKKFNIRRIVIYK